MYVGSHGMKEVNMQVIENGITYYFSQVCWIAAGENMP